MFGWTDSTGLTLFTSNRGGAMHCYRPWERAVSEAFAVEIIDFAIAPGDTSSKWQ